MDIKEEDNEKWDKVDEGRWTSKKKTMKSGT